MIGLNLYIAVDNSNPADLSAIPRPTNWAEILRNCSAPVSKPSMTANSEIHQWQQLQKQPPTDATNRLTEASILAGAFPETVYIIRTREFLAESYDVSKNSQPNGEWTGRGPSGEKLICAT